jgi:hypothetical protein
MKDPRERPKSAVSDAAGGGPGLADDALYHALATRERRRTLYVLLDRGECETAELATVLTGWDASETEPMVGPDDRRAVLTRLHHVDLPLLADVGLITHDADDGIVRLERIDPSVADLVVDSIEAEDADER